MVNPQSMAAIFHASNPNVFAAPPPGVQGGGPAPVQQGPVPNVGLPGQGLAGTNNMGPTQQVQAGLNHPGAGAVGGGATLTPLLQLMQVLLVVILSAIRGPNLIYLI